MNKEIKPLSYEEILKPIKSDLKRVEAILVKNLETDIPLLNAVSQYILKAGGKRFRPALLLLASALIGKIDEKACITAAVIEYIHTATLLHDDVVDNADLRRNKKAARSIWGNEASVLVGDYLFTVSFQYLADFEDPELIKILSLATTAMARGEIIQLERNNAEATEEDYLKIIHYKTATLIGTAMSLGAKIAGGDEAACEKLYQCGLNLGMAFQMIDDALDYNITEAETGKDIGTDLKERKITLPLSHLIDKAESKDKKEVLDILEKDIITDEDVIRVFNLMKKYGSIDYTLERAKGYSEATKSSISDLPDNDYRRSITHLADFIISRKV